MSFKSIVVALCFLLPVLSVNTVQADEYLIISNLPSNFNADEIRKMVERHGKIRSINCVETQYTGRIKGSCYILMWSAENARKAVTALNGNKFDGRDLYAKEIYPLPCPEILVMSGIDVEFLPKIMGQKQG